MCAGEIANRIHLGKLYNIHDNSIAHIVHILFGMGQPVDNRFAIDSVLTVPRTLINP